MSVCLSGRSPDCWGPILLLAHRADCLWLRSLTGCWILSLVTQAVSGMLPLPLALSQCSTSTQTAAIPIVMRFCCHGSICGRSPVRANKQCSDLRRMCKSKLWLCRGLVPCSSGRGVCVVVLTCWLGGNEPAGGQSARSPAALMWGLPKATVSDRPGWRSSWPWAGTCPEVLWWCDMVTREELFER